MFNLQGNRICLLGRIFRVMPGLIWDRREFKHLLRQIKGHTVVGKKRCFWIWLLAKYAATKKGQMAENALVLKKVDLRAMIEEIIEKAKGVDLDRLEEEIEEEANRLARKK